MEITYMKNREEIILEYANIKDEIHNKKEP